LEVTCWPVIIPKVGIHAGRARTRRQDVAIGREEGV